MLISKWVTYLVFRGGGFSGIFCEKLRTGSVCFFVKRMSVEKFQAADFLGKFANFERWGLVVLYFLVPAKPGLFCRAWWT